MHAGSYNNHRLSIVKQQDTDTQHMNMHNLPANEARKQLAARLRSFDWEASRKQREVFFQYVRDFQEKKDREVCCVGMSYVQLLWLCVFHMRGMVWSAL